MCLILLAYEFHPEYRLVLAANRDEFYDRPTRAAEFWEDEPDVLAGRDLQHGGTWLGVTRAGRFAAVTNYRGPSSKLNGAPSRGALVSDYLKGHDAPEKYLIELATSASRFNGFNLLVGDSKAIHYYSNRGAPQAKLDAGLYGLSNHLLNTSWPKVERGKTALADVLKRSSAINVDSIIEILLDRVLAEDQALPETGVGLEVERALSPMFIVTPVYGTRSSTVVLIDRKGTMTFVERTFDEQRGTWNDVRHELEL